MSSATSPNRRVAAGRCTIFFLYFFSSYTTKRYCNEHSNGGLQFEWVERGLDLKWANHRKTHTHTHTKTCYDYWPTRRKINKENITRCFPFSLSHHRHHILQYVPMWSKPIKDSWDEIWLKSSSPITPMSLTTTMTTTERESARWGYKSTSRALLRW